MSLGISLVMSVFNRTNLFRLSWPTWLEGNEAHPERTWPDEILIVNDGGATDLEQAVQEMQAQYPDLPITYQYHDKGYSHWSNPAIPHNWLVKQAKGPIVVILDPEVAFINDGLPYIHSFFHDYKYEGIHQDSLRNRRRCSISAGTNYSIQTEFMHVAGGIPAHKLPHHHEHISTNPASHQVILRHGAAHEYRAWWKDRYIALGGKDERYMGWGYEDLDIAHRNVRLEGAPGGKDACDHRVEIVVYGHGLTQLNSGVFSVNANKELWEKDSPEDGVANRGKEWGKLRQSGPQ